MTHIGGPTLLIAPAYRRILSDPGGLSAAAFGRTDDELGMRRIVMQRGRPPAAKLGGCAVRCIQVSATPSP